MEDSPAVINYDTDGYKLPVKDGEALTAFTPGLIIAGVDGSGNAQFLRLTTSGKLEVIPGTGRTLIGRYYATTAFITGAAATQNLATLENPVGSGRTIYLRKIAVHGVLTGTFSTAIFYLLKRANVFPTGGTVIGSAKRNTSEGNASGIVRQSPTVTLAAANLWANNPGVRSNALAFIPPTTEVLLASFDDDEVVLQAGEAVGIHVDANSTNWFHYVCFHWSEA